jgi:hypothetical protein
LNIEKEILTINSRIHGPYNILIRRRGETIDRIKETIITEIRTNNKFVIYTLMSLKVKK